VETLLTSGPSGSIVNAQSAVSMILVALRLTARLALVAAYSREKRWGRSRGCVSATGSAVSSISKIRSRLSMRGTTRRWWRLARTEAAVSPASARAFSTFKAESSRSWCEEGDTLCHQESAFSLMTLPVQGGWPGSLSRR
jgi:hypothetical protein